jgi:hypothetical protein
MRDAQQGEGCFWRSAPKTPQQTPLPRRTLKYVKNIIFIKYTLSLAVVWGITNVMREDQR